MPIPKLILHPVDPSAAAAPAAVVAKLRDIGLIAEAAGRPAEPALGVGEAFLSLVSFLGCSPAVATASRFDGDTAYCHVRLGGPTPAARYRGDDRAPTPRCPRCRADVADRDAVLRSWQADPAGYRWRCPACGAALPVHEINWRQAAGFARLFVEVWNVHPSEAVPGERLLGALGELTGGPWTYFYSRD
jgi:hypothetical protein